MPWSDNWIMVKGLCNETETPGSGLWLDDLPDMGRWKLEAISDPSWEDFSNVWDKVYRRSIRNMGTDIRLNMPDAIRSSNVLQNVIFGEYESEYQAITGTGRYRGIYVRVDGSQYLDLYLNQVQVYLAAAGNVTVKVFDGKTGEELYTKTFTGSQYHNNFQINQNFTTEGQWKEFFICYDDTGHTSFQSLAQYPAWIHNYDHWLSVRGANVATGSSPIESNLSFDDSTGGLIANWNLYCSIDSFICQHRHALANALLYKCGLEMCKELISNDRAISRYTLVSREELEQRGKMIEEDYMNHLKMVLNTVHPVIDEVCFHCQPSVHWRINVPLNRGRGWRKK